MAVEKKEVFSSILAKVNDTFLPMLERQLVGNGIQMDGYGRQCALSALSAMHTVLETKGVTWQDPQLDRSNIHQILQTVATMKLNASASPREVYFQLRNTSVKAKDETGKEVTVWRKKMEMGIEGDGNDAILARYGRDVKKVGQFWLVRENDKFEYPIYSGLEVQPPKWTPTGKGDVVRVVYPILKNDNSIEWYISEREDVARNLFAHINNNLMNETFGICESRYKASPAQLAQITTKKNEVLKKAKDLGLDALDDLDLQKWISPAWSEFHSREAMLIRKMRNNITRKIPKNFGSAYVEMIYQVASDEAYAEQRREVAANANRETIEIKAEIVPEAGDSGHGDPPPDQEGQGQPPSSPPNPQKPADCGF